MKIVKLAFGLLCVLVLACNVLAISRWNEARGVYDDVCYLRQAHLFQRFGISGIDTDAIRDDDGYFQGKLKEIGFSDWNDAKRWPCHTPIGDKMVLQYPPGTGFLLALFPQGHQAAPLYVAASLIACGIALLGIALSGTLATTVGMGTFGALAILMMVSPSKASYSIAPTMAVCALAGFLTARWLAAGRRNVLLATLIGFLIGLSVDFRLPNLFLASGYLLFLVASFLRSRQRTALMEGLGFGAAFVAGMLPTLVANAVNAGSPLATTYGGADVVGPAFSPSVLGQYLRDVQFLLILLAAGSAAWQWWMGRPDQRQGVIVVAGNLIVNLAFFLSHPIFTPYYMMPIAMLSLWSMSFAASMQPAEAATCAGPRPKSLEAVAQRAADEDVRRSRTPFKRGRKLRAGPVDLGVCGCYPAHLLDAFSQREPVSTSLEKR